MLATNNATLADLRPGQSVTISYQSSHGVRVAGHIRQNSMRVEGVVAAINPNTGEVTLKRHGLEMSKTLRIARNCQVALNGNRGGKLVDIHPGDTVAITYETPNGLPTAEQISVTSAAFVGTLTEIEPSEHIVKAEAGSVTKEFALGEHCTIVVNGKPDGTLSQLAPNERVVLDYQPVNGVNIVDWIGPAPAASQTKLRSAASSSHSSYPMSYPTGY
ncbi:MAG TPA: hypothetical protein VL970_15445 [Candidatus Acidoferrales bacterium]|nr:hypothetical protein [Candidatus Acidoferrales bacterium]